MAIGDLLFSMMGQDNPRDKIAAALAQAQHPSALATPQAAAQAQAPQSADPNYGNPQSSGGPGTTGAANPPPQAPPQPQAYTSPPDMVQLYTALAERQSNNASIDRGLGLLLGAFAKPQDRAGMLQAMTAPQPDAGAMMQNSVKLSNDAFTMGQRGISEQNLPAIASQLGIPLEQAQSMFANGTLDNLLQQYNTPDPIMKEYNDYKKTAGANPMSLLDFKKEAARVAALKWSNSGITVTRPGPDGKPQMGILQVNNAGGNQVLPVEGNWAPMSPYDKAAQTAEGGVTGKQAANLPISDAMRQQGSDLIDDLLKNGDLKGTSGFRSHIEPYIFGSSGETQSKLNQLQSLGFLQAYRQLQGGGSISDAEGSKATGAFSRLEHPELLTEEGMKQALLDAQAALKTMGTAQHIQGGDKSGGGGGRTRVYVPGKGWQ